jgi:hypothetical protein
VNPTKAPLLFLAGEEGHFLVFLHFRAKVGQRTTMPSASRRRKAGMKRETTPTPHADRTPDDGQVRARVAVRTSAAKLERV